MFICDVLNSITYWSFTCVNLVYKQTVMRILITLLFALTSLLFIESCGSSNNVYSKSILQKRKYTKGRFFKGHKIQSSAQKNIKAQLVDEDNTEQSVVVDPEIQVYTELTKDYAEGISQNAIPSIESSKVNVVHNPQNSHFKNQLTTTGNTIVEKLKQLNPKPFVESKVEDYLEVNKKKNIYLILFAFFLLAAIILFFSAVSSEVYILAIPLLIALIMAIISLILTLVNTYKAHSLKKNLTKEEINNAKKGGRNKETLKKEKPKKVPGSKYEVFGWLALTFLALAIGLGIYASSAVIFIPLFIITIVFGIIYLALRSKYKKNVA